MLRAAARVFGKHGYHGASMDEIAELAGITKPMLYSYFDSKEGLFAACGESAAELLSERLRNVAETGDLPPDQRLWRGLVGVFSFVGDHQELLFAFNPPSGFAGLTGAREISACGREAITELLEELLRTGPLNECIGPENAVHISPLAHALTATVMAIAEWWIRHPDEPPELQALRVMNFAWTGVGRLLEGDLWLPED